MEQQQTFHALPPPPKGWAFADTYVDSNLKKWGLHTNTRVQRFRFEKRHHRLAAKEFLMELFNDATVQESLKVLAEGNEWVSPQSITDVACEVVPADLVSLEFFDRLSDCEPAVVRSAGSVKGSLVKCMDQVVDGFTVQDMLREMLLCEESDNAELFSEVDQKQLLYRLLSHVVLGGPMCQYEEELTPYVETVKRLYRSLLSVAKNPSSGTVEVTSVVYAVQSVEAETWRLFPKPSRQNFMYVCVDPMRRNCTVWYNAHTSIW